MKLIKYSLLLIAILLFINGSVFAGGEGEESGQSVLTISSDFSDPAPKEGIETLVKKFEEENPNIDVQLTIFDHEGYKTSIRNFLVSDAPDLVNWYPGNRMKQFVDAELFADTSDLWNKSLKAEMTDGAYVVSTMNGKQYGLPLTYYHWGIYYRTDLFEAAGITGTPTTWDEFLDACAKLKANGTTPITIGTKYLWTSAGWFDHLTLAVQGFEFYQAVTKGEIPYTDPRVKEVFSYWAQLLDNGYFLKDHATYSWQEGNAFMLQGKAAMYLIGNFVAPTFGEDTDKYGFFPFPVINADLPRYAEAPADSIFITSKAKNREAAEKFLVFAARKDNQEMLANILQQLPTNRNATPPNDKFNQAGAKLLGEAKGLAQFYDRDADPDMASEGMKGFQEFMIDTGKLDSVLAKIEATRKKLYE